MDFKTKYAERINDRGVLCVGLDPLTPDQGMKNTIPKKYIEKYKVSSDARLNFCLDMIDLVHDHAVAVKPNQQFLRGFTTMQNKVLTEYAKLAGLLTIKDYKLNDIGNTVESALFYLQAEGYDAVTFNPLMGNLQECTKMAHDKDIGLFVLTLTSNPEAEIYLRRAQMNGRPLFEAIATQVNACNADGCVVGATGHITEEDVKTISRLAGEDKVLLIPGIGTQGGDEPKFKGVRLPLINVGSDITYNADPGARAKYYSERFKATLR